MGPDQPTLGQAASHLANTLFGQPEQEDFIFYALTTFLILFPLALTLRIFLSIRANRRKVQTERTSQVTHQDHLPAPPAR